MGEFKVKDRETILFNGDSITDCGRRESPNLLGNGYVNLFTQIVTAKYPERKIKYINKGIGGNSVIELKERWEDDVMVYEPDWLTIMIGINDLHRFLRNPDLTVPPELYRETYDFLLEETKKRISNIKIILLEPFFISKTNVEDTFRKKVLDIIPEYIGIVHEMAKKYKTRLVKTHSIFQKHIKYRDSDTFCPEPVHPNMQGHMIIAEELLKAFSE